MAVNLDAEGTKGHDEYCVKYELNQYKKMRIEGKFWIGRTANESI